MKQHVLRYWEGEFPSLRPRRAGSRQRLYRRQDVEQVLVIKRLLHEEGFTIAGARKALRRLQQQGGTAAAAPLPPGASARRPEGGDGEWLRLQALIKQELAGLKQMLEAGDLTPPAGNGK